MSRLFFPRREAPLQELPYRHRSFDCANHRVCPPGARTLVCFRGGGTIVGRVLSRLNPAHAGKTTPPHTAAKKGLRTSKEGSSSRSVESLGRRSAILSFRNKARV